jgi:hypothetical protein
MATPPETPADWLTQGQTHEAQGTEAALAESRSFRINLAAAWLNRAEALLAISLIETNAAHIAAGQALGIASKAEHDDPLVAEVALKARHALCAALSHQLANGTSLAHQPQFLAEFLLENLEAKISSAEFHATTADSLAQADAYNRSLLDPSNERLRRPRSELAAAE